MQSSVSHPTQGSFINGFTIGLFAGAVGFFLFGTDKGGKVRQTISKEWDSAKEHLAKEGVIPSAKVSIRDVVSQVVEMFTPDTTASNPTSNSRATKSMTKKPGKSAKASPVDEVSKKRTFKNIS